MHKSCWDFAQIMLRLCINCAHAQHGKFCTFSDGKKKACRCCHLPSFPSVFPLTREMSPESMWRKQFSVRQKQCLNIFKCFWGRQKTTHEYILICLLQAKNNAWIYSDMFIAGKKQRMNIFWYVCKSKKQFSIAWIKQVLSDFQKSVWISMFEY